MTFSGDSSDICIPSVFVQQWVYRDLRAQIQMIKLDNQDDDSLFVILFKSNEMQWPLLDIIVVTVVSPIVIMGK